MKDDKHIHGGHSSKGTYDPLLVFDKIGLKKGERVLDGGCGDGYLSMVASRIVGESGKIFSYDIHENSIMILKKRVEHGRFQNIEVDMRDLLDPLPIESGSLDLIIFSNVFHGFVYNNEIDPIIDMIDEKLKPDGKVAMIEFLKEETEIGPPIEHRISSDEIQSILENIGFDLEDDFRISNDHYLVVFKRSTG